MVGRVRHRGWIWLAALWLATIPSAWADEPKLTAEVDRTSVTEGDAIILTVTLEGFSRNKEGPILPDIDGFEIYDAGHSTNMSIVNGSFSSSTTHTYQLVARKAGTFTLGAIEVRDKGKSYKTRPLGLEIVAAQVPDAPGGGQARPDDRAPAPSGTSGLFARVEVDKDEAFVDEQILLHFRLYQRTDVRIYEISGFEPPVTSGFWREDLGQQQQEYNVRIQGDVYRVREISWALYPTQPGELEIGAGRVVCHIPDTSRQRRRGNFDIFGGGLFNRKPVELMTEPVRIHVKPLPEEGKPAGFTGTVGQYEIEAAFDNQEARQGEPLALTVTIRGTGHIQTIGAPDWPAWDGMRVYDSGEAVSVNKRRDRVDGEKTFTQVLIPTRTGRIAFEPIRFAYFDPAQARYITASSHPLAIDALPAAPMPAGGGSDHIVSMGEDILYIQTGLAERLGPAGRGGLNAGWLIHIVPLLLIGAGALVHRRRTTLAADPVLARRRAALRRARQALAHLDRTADTARLAAGLAETLEAYLSDWLDIEVRGLRRADLRTELERAGLAEELIATGLGLLDWVDEVRFGAGAGGASGEGKITETERWLGACEDAFKQSANGAGGSRALLGLVVLALLLPAGVVSVQASQRPQQSIVEALRQAEAAYEDGRYGDALALYERVADAGWQSAELYYNLGCAAFKEGRVGWAVAYLEEARRLAPRDPNIRHNLNIASSRSRDRLPEEERPSWLLLALTRLLDSYAPADGVRALLVLLWASAAGLLLYWLGPPFLRRPSRYALLLCGALGLIAVVGISLKAYQIATAPSGVVVASEAQILSGPRSGETVQFVLHEGTLLHLGRDAGAWREIWLNEEMRGWLPSEQVAALRSPNWLP